MSEAQPDNNSVDTGTEPIPDLAWPSPGKKLREAREGQGLTQSFVAESLHLTVHYINALEQDEYQKLPGLTFVKGYFKSYARLLKIDVEDVVKTFEQYTAAQEQNRATEAQVIRKRKAANQNSRWLICAAFIIVAALAAAWWFGHDTSQEQQVSVNPVSPGNIEINTVQDTQSVVTAEVLANRAILTDVVTNSPSGAVQSQNAEQNDVPLITQSQNEGAGESELLEDMTPENQPEETADEIAGFDMPREPALPSAQGNKVEQAEIVDDDSSQYSERNVNGARIISLNTDGEDSVLLHVNGPSWVEVDDNAQGRLFNDNLYAGDELIIRGEAPFNILIGNANMVDLVFNSESVDIQSSIRSDNSARIILEP